MQQTFFSRIHCLRCAIFLIFCIALLTLSCTTNKNQVSDFPDIEISAETVSEGILVTFSNFSNIPSEIDALIIAFVDLLGSEEPGLENNEPHAIMNSFSNRRVSQNWEKGIYSSMLEQVKQTGTVIFPFVQSGHKYSIMAVFANNKLPTPECVVKTINTECVADGGIYLNKNITLNMNNDRTGVTISSKPVFTKDVQYEKMQYCIIVHNGDYTEAIGSYTDDLFWDFEPQFGKYLTEAGVANGNYPAVVGASLHIIHDNISWLLEIAYTSVFNYSL